MHSHRDLLSLRIVLWVFVGFLYRKSVGRAQEVSRKSRSTRGRSAGQAARLVRSAHLPLARVAITCCQLGVPCAAACRYMAALLQPYKGEGLDPKWTEPGPVQPRMGVELLSCSS